MNEDNMYYNNSTSNLVDVNTGLFRGNMFDSLYKPYVQPMPLSIGIMSEEEKEMRNIQAHDFAIKDIGLYLDVYPEDKEMIDVYNYYNDELKKAVSSYEKKYGPLTLYSETLKNYPWLWIKGPWPWERQAN